LSAFFRKLKWWKWRVLNWDCGEDEDFIHHPVWLNP
jgi:hypothetical protein